MLSTTITIQIDPTPGSSFKKLDPDSFSAPSSSLYSKSRGWSAFDAGDAHVKRESSGVSHVHAQGEYVCVTSGGRLGLHRNSPDERGEDGVVQKRQISRFESNAYCGRLRHDGKLVVAGTEAGDVKVFDSTTKSIMRTFRGHASASRTIRWSLDGHKIVSGSNDGTARVWDLANENEIAKFSDHEDHVRGVGALEEFTWVTGSYDHCVRTWDVRDSLNVAFKGNHGAPIEDVLVSPWPTSGSKIVYTVGGNEICAWDLRNASAPLIRACHHQKTVTSVIANNIGEPFLLTSSLDGSIKCLDPETLGSVHGLFLTKGQILSMALTPDDWRVCLGTAEGDFSVITRRGPPPDMTGGTARKRSISTTSAVTGNASHQVDAVVTADANLLGATISLTSTRKHARLPVRAGTHRYFVRGRMAIPSAEDDVVVVGSAAGKRSKKRRAHDEFLKNFAYKDALDAALETKEPATVVSVLEEFHQRGPEVLSIALSGRDEVTLEPILSFVARYVIVPRFAPVLTHVCDTLLTSYSVVLGESLVVDTQLARLHQNVRQELEIQKKLAGVLGSVEMILGNNI